eukprot:2580359-Rhodomonas_salina.1
MAFIVTKHCVVVEQDFDPHLTGRAAPPFCGTFSYHSITISSTKPVFGHGTVGRYAGHRAGTDLTTPCTTSTNSNNIL